MIKTVSLNSVFTPSGNVDLANEIIGKVVEPQLRWSPGSLVNSALSTSEVPLIVVITGAALFLLDGSGSGAPMENVDGFLLDIDEVEGYLAHDVFTAEAGDSKSKTILVGGITPTSTLALEDTALGDSHPVYQIFTPKRPAFTVLSLINAVENAFLTNGDHYVIVVDQRSETVTVVLFDSASDAESHGAAYAGGFSSDRKVAAYNTTFEAGSSSTPSFGWE